MHFLVNSIHDLLCQVKLVSGTCNVLSWLSLAVAWLQAAISSLALAVALADVLVKALRLWVDRRTGQGADMCKSQGVGETDAECYEELFERG